MMTTVETASTEAQNKGFWDTLEIWLKKPHVINRRLCGSRVVWECTATVACPPEEYLPAIQRAKLDGAKLDDENVARDTVTVGDSNNDPESEKRMLKICLRELLPRQVQRFYILRELVVYDEAHSCATYVPVGHMKHDGTPCSCSEPGESGERSENIGAGDIAYCIQLDLEHSRISIKVDNAELIPHKQSLGCSVTWLTTTLLPKLARWGGQEVLNTEVTSLRLMAVSRYNQVYQQLKAKYGPRLVEIWPEKTDPQKFVYEDIAIASYLLVIWEEERQRKQLCKKQSFVDLGCGNGLLVHILASEGHPGLGLDVRKRNIWDLYGEATQLKESPIIPSDETLFPEYDWLIGNHSDELTPWIPVMAARSSYQCCYFVLPCCPWDFVGKFRHKEQGVSQYRSYLGYVQSVGEKCGFRVEEDTLRIPSTKRVCFIGRSRTYAQDKEAEADVERKTFLQERCRCQTSGPQTAAQGSTTASDSHTGLESPQASCDCQPGANQNPCYHGNRDTAGPASWAATFQARDRVEKVRNCVRLDKDLKERIIKTVFETLVHAGDAKVISLGGGQEWNAGGSLPLSEVVQLFDKSTLQELKSECGGLQTLLRNAHFVFLVRGGTVQLRDWTSSDHSSHQVAKKKRKGHGKVDTSNKTKTRMCFFHENHPDGCPLSAQDCRFAHGHDELREFEPENLSSESKLL